ncbi:MULTISPECIES: rRNA adenine methyltransferase [Mucilaginibacter]|uniref:rRNA adenine methyltransferase n=1 Tax=Mucilaginibacter rubeus TaxID=2027860 RepID=A0A5C1I665_9SPHI|nr:MULTISPECIES: rRNA adenine methyltransferase [Mucilaginibacter]QEM13286.1 rRNA adenine methyltransferase [Mucilaginibacter rubeus]
MQIDPENHVNKLCGQGMLLEGEGKPNEASALFHQAWDEATNATEKFIAAHYVARHQQSVADKLKWDETALNLALGIEGDEVKPVYPSLYLNIAKCHEDLKNLDKALENYQLGLSFTQFLPDDGYGNMIRAGINNGIERVSIL